MKTILTALLLGLSYNAFSQVIIGDDRGTATDKTSVLLEFAKTENRGIVLPYVTTLPTSPTAGTLLLDAETNTAAQVKYFNGTSWISLNDDTADVTTEITYQNAATEATEATVIIGANTSTADGILVLESSNKAMVLPTVSSIDDIINPAPGMMVYISTDKQLAVFNGANWTLWKGK